MRSVRHILEEHTIVVENPALRQGFTQIPNYVLRDAALSLGARLTYTMLLSYAWQAGSCFPGQERVARDLGVSRQSISAFLSELRRAGYVDWERRGLGKTNVYYLRDRAASRGEADVKQALHPVVKRGRHTVVKSSLQQEYAGRTDPQEEYPALANA